MDAQIWYGLLDTERAIRYYSYLADRFAWLHKILSITMILAGSSAGAAFIAQFPPAVMAAAVFFVSFAAAWQWSSSYHAKSVAATLMNQQYRELTIEWRRLWYSGDNNPEQIDSLKRRFEAIGAGYSIETDEKLNQKAAEETYESLPAEFGN